MTRFSLVAAIAKNGVIGRANGMPWHIPEDLRHFRKLTMGKPILMGRKTKESLGRPLPGRQNLVLSRTISRDIAHPETEFHFVRDLEGAVNASNSAEEIMVIGGAEIYSLCLPRCEKLHLTLIHQSYDGDTYFPAYDPSEFHETERTECGGESDPDLRYAFVTLNRLA